jgi:hypothetical protein
VVVLDIGMPFDAAHLELQMTYVETHFSRALVLDGAIAQAALPAKVLSLLGTETLQAAL